MLINILCRSMARRAALSIVLCLAALPSFASEMIHVLPGTEVRLVLNEPLSSKFVHKGQNFKLLVEKDVRVHGQVVVPKGAEAVGIVVRTSGSSVGGKPGEVYVRVQYLDLNGRHIALFSGAGAREKGSDGAAVVLSALFGPIGVLTRGKEVVFPVGMPFLAYIDQAFDVPVATLPAVAPNLPNVDAAASTTSIPDSAARTENVQEKN